MLERENSGMTEMNGFHFTLGLSRPAPDSPAWFTGLQCGNPWFIAAEWRARECCALHKTPGLCRHHRFSLFQQNTPTLPNYLPLFANIFFVAYTHTVNIYIFNFPLLWLFKWNLASSKLVCSCTYTFIYIYIGIQMFEIYFCCMTSREIFFLSKTTWQDHRPTS